MLVADAIFVEEFGHLLRDHVAVIGDGDQRNLFPLGGGGLRLGLFCLIAHKQKYTPPGGEKGRYSKASSEDFSGNVRLQFVQVTK
jgi:hypothetical protein